MTGGFSIQENLSQFGNEENLSGRIRQSETSRGLELGYERMQIKEYSIGYRQGRIEPTIGGRNKERRTPFVIRCPPFDPALFYFAVFCRSFHRFQLNQAERCSFCRLHLQGLLSGCLRNSSNIHEPHMALISLPRAYTSAAWRARLGYGVPADSVPKWDEPPHTAPCCVLPVVP